MDTRRDVDETELRFQGSYVHLEVKETPGPIVCEEFEDPDDQGLAQPMHRRGTPLETRHSELPKTSVKRKLGPVPLQATQDKMPDASDLAFQNISKKTDTQEMPDAPGVPFQILFCR